MPPFVTAYLGFGPRYSGFLSYLPTNTTIFCAACYYVEKEDPSKGYQKPKRKWDVATHLSEIIERKIWEENPVPHNPCI